MKRVASLLLLLAFVMLSSTVVPAKTLMLEGRLNSSIAMRQQMEFSVDQGTVQTFSFKYALPAEYRTKSVGQTIEGLNTRFSPQPSSSTIEKDRYGNRFQRVTWNNVRESIRISLGYTANVRSELSAMESRTPFPIGRVPASEAVFLQSTEMVQSDAPQIAELARRLTSGANSQYEAVTAITNHVTDVIKYTFNPPKYDALYTLNTRSGNCQNLAHLSIALLRSVGIPARIVGGITLKDAWKVPVDARNSIVQSMGQGGHAWMEIYFPDLGWLSYDPQQSRQFTSSRHVKQTHGLDSRDINDTWRGTPYLPRYSELIEGTFSNDDIKLKVKATGKTPRPYIISNLVSARGVPATIEPSSDTATPAVKSKVKVKPGKKTPPPVKPDDGTVFGPAELDQPDTGDDDEIRLTRPSKVSKPVKKPVKRITKPKVKKPATKVVKPVKPLHKRLAAGTPMLFGNMEFPNLVSAFSVQGNIGTRILDKETSEYVTSRYIYAQAFQIKDSMALSKVSLAMRKFGGDGTVYVDLVRDDGSNKPNIVDGTRSKPVYLEHIPRKPCYYWVDFFFHQDGQSRLKPGKYWIVFRYSGEAIMNWFYIPGKPYSDSDDTRSTAKGFEWEDILNCDFVFKVTGKAI